MAEAARRPPFRGRWTPSTAWWRRRRSRPTAPRPGPSPPPGPATASCSRVRREPGKSQTITNILADQMAQGRRVLFVAEKGAALDVVRHRLGEVGLLPYALDLHDHNARPVEVRARLKTALAQRVRPDLDGYRAALGDVEGSSSALRRYADRLHRTNRAGLSLWSARATALARGRGPTLTVPPAVLGEDTSAGGLDLELLRRMVARAVDELALLDPDTVRAWGFVGVGPEPVDPAESRRGASLGRGCGRGGPGRDGLRAARVERAAPARVDVAVPRRPHPAAVRARQRVRAGRAQQRPLGVGPVRAGRADGCAATGRRAGPDRLRCRRARHRPRAGPTGPADRRELLLPRPQGTAAERGRSGAGPPAARPDDLAQGAAVPGRRTGRARDAAAGAGRQLAGAAGSDLAPPGTQSAVRRRHRAARCRPRRG